MKKLDIDFIKECVSNGLTDYEISKLLNCHRVSVTRARKQNGIKKKSMEDVRDKYYICVKCHKKVYIKRKELRKLFCEDCLKNL